MSTTEETTAPDDRTAEEAAEAAAHVRVPGPAMSIEALDAAVVHLTSDHSVLRLSETEAEQRSGVQLVDGEPGGERMIMNMGPAHPSTHGVLRLILTLDGETVTELRPVIGYLHTGMEKTGEDLTYVQGCTNVTRMDYAAPLFNEIASYEVQHAHVPPTGAPC